jgi:general secretion pathway protein A
MYLQAFGLKKNPFGMTPDPGFLYLTAQHREVLAGLAYSILDRKGFVVLIGDAGTGKTTLLTRVLEYLPAERIQTSVILNPTLTPAEFLEMALADFGITDIPDSKARRILKLQEFLLKARSNGKICALIVDEAHKLNPEVLEEIRLLGNFEDSDAKLLQILLIGQSELSEVLNREDLRQLKQRVAMRFTINPLSAAEVGTYIQHRWSRAGGSATPFQSEAVEEIAKCSRCIPRVINVLCDNTLMLALSKGENAVTRKLVQETAKDLQLTGVPPAAPAVNGAVEAKPAMQPVAMAPAQEPAAFLPTIRSLERYSTAPVRSSLWARWVSKLGLA